MRISAQEEYGLRCILQVARHQGDHPVSTNDIAMAEGISKQYVAKLLGRLQQAGLLVSTRGIRGGFLLARPATEIPIGVVIEALGGTLKSQHHANAICDEFVGNRDQCVHHGNCGIRPLWSLILRHVTELLQKLTLQTLLDEEAGAAHHIEQQYQALKDHDVSQEASV